MDRRRFLGGSLAGSWTLGAGVRGAFAAEPAGGSASPEFYELRTYRLRIGPQKKALDDFLSGTALPAWNRAGITPVGVFETILGPDVPTVHVLLTHKSLDTLTSPGVRLEPAEPAYVRYESALLRAFENVPRLEVPASKGTDRPRIFELRIYESPGEAAHARKMEMFTRLGELAIFRRTGLVPVFFGQTLVGSRLPNFVYMLTFEDMAAREKAWGAFRVDPDWKKLSATPGYTDAEIMSNITNLLLRPTPYSQV
jgi:hypothetical protein